MKIALVIYPGFTALDIVGPFQVLADVPGHDVHIVAHHAGPVPDHTGRLALTATSFDDLPDPDIIVVGGALDDRPPDTATVEWLRQVHPNAQWTTSVCTGSLYLAAAGILDDIDEATCHWARAHRLEQYGTTYTPRRVVRQDRVITAAGVSSGIDMALRLLDELYGPALAQSVQLAIEYDPEPPHDVGSPTKASPELVTAVRALLNPPPPAAAQ